MPDTFQTDYGPGNNPRFADIDSSIEFLDWLADRRPLIAHNIGLSIGSAGIFDLDYVARLAHWQQTFRFLWQSDHLSFSQVRGADAHDYNAGLAVPVPYDTEVLDLIVQRVEQVQHTVPAPFLLENNVYYVDIPEQDMTEPEFLNGLSLLTNCGLLLDVHNLYVNARNHGFDPAGFIEQLDLTRVVEVHIAGGNELAGMYADSHAGPSPEPVWILLEQVVANAPNLCAITFEFHESYYPRLGVNGIQAELARARSVWKRHN